MELTLIKVFLPTALAFLLGLAVTPFVTHYLYKFRLWKQKAGKGNGYGGGGTPLFDQLHNDRDTNTPRLGGIVIWSSVFLTVFLVFVLQFLFPDSIFGKLNFLSRSQTWLPLLALAIGAAVGAVDDLATVKGNGKHFAGGLPLSQRLVVVGLTAILSGWWFYSKLDVSSVSMLGWGELQLGAWFIPFFVFVAVCVYMSSVIDGLDGLAGGVFMFVFTAYAGIAFYQGQYDIAALCATIVGGILAFLWFNIPPARFYMTETGVMALTMSLTVIAFMTDVLGEGEGVSVLPIVGFLLVATVAANVLQITWKKLFGRKLFLIAPLHHHFEAIGWPAYKVTMRYWVLGFVFAIIGILVTIGI
ncbi:hypothetical protein A2837_02255 [Candidatus Kaiserbacteria bacterium RIFCSPHIGHO2_01_FULL_46_22]|uniref:Phospho-N-acetylmuramoyl-pentapeptide-transferase n=1 Tax=Candidatus Kaiserbacteria bacterium RIFCSPHIGHO2_01_FULL_46_22 TaxID=1798475 RepID=A0A1F6BYG1_9BACT|nr:MAG: hypothetical protein A2837_02255 [Candidatus Kaiserbacteria bacterium RIFCSPHIGHO2_01_FULL_46_22]